jgi:site-specific DNA recombinase
MSRRKSTSVPVTTTPCVAIYCRVSTSGQEDNYSLPTQEDACRAYAEERGWKIVAVYREQHTGAELWERPKLTELREMVRGGAVDIVLAYALDRLSRKQTHVAIVAEEVERAGGRLVFVTEDFEDSTVGTFIRNAKAFAAEVQREKIAENTKRGLHARIAAGKMKPGPRPLYGYRWSDASRSALIPDPVTRTVVERIFAAVAAGETVRSLAAHLTRTGVPTPSGRGKQWYVSTINFILHHPAYKGEARALCDWSAGRLTSYETGVALPAGTIPSLVDASVWATAQAVMTRNHERSLRNNRHPDVGLLRCLAVCGHCGGTMHLTPNKHPRTGKIVFTYRCGRAARAGGTCTRHSILTETLDAAAWEKACLILDDEAVIREGYERAKTENPVAHDLAAVERSLADVERRAGNTSRAISLLDDDAAAAPLLAELRSLAKQADGLRAERDRLSTQQEAWAATQVNLDDLLALRLRVRENTKRLSIAEKRQVLEAFGMRVTVYRTGHSPRWEVTARIGAEIMNRNAMCSARRPAA